MDGVVSLPRVNHIITGACHDHVRRGLEGGHVMTRVILIMIVLAARSARMPLAIPDPVIRRSAHDVPSIALDIIEAGIVHIGELLRYEVLWILEIDNLERSHVIGKLCEMAFPAPIAGTLDGEQRLVLEPQPLLSVVAHDIDPFREVAKIEFLAFEYERVAGRVKIIDAAEDGGLHGVKVLELDTIFSRPGVDMEGLEAGFVGHVQNDAVIAFCRVDMDLSASGNGCGDRVVSALGVDAGLAGRVERPHSVVPAAAHNHVPATSADDQIVGRPSRKSLVS